jgi:hypothetical protein
MAAFQTIHSDAVLSAVVAVGLPMGGTFSKNPPKTELLRGEI